jgi:hypothetical protein
MDTPALVVRELKREVKPGKVGLSVEGENELWMAVAEKFGGWGIQARFEDMEGIEIR